jgi:YegS/Rv2252/BmrU family lipid kinase
MPLTTNTQRLTPTRCLVIRNPAARHQLPVARLDAVLDIARAAGWIVEVVQTERAGAGTELARDAVSRGIDVIAVNGGDGTLNEVLNGVAGSNVAIGVIPGGTANVWARETRISLDPLQAMRDIVEGDRRRIDLGRAGGRYFLLMAGAGLDARVMPRVTPRMKKRLGAAAYVVAGFRTVFGSKAVRARIRIDGGSPQDTTLYWMIAGNTRSYGGLVDILSWAEADDGLLDVGVMHGGGPLQVVFAGARLFTRRHRGSPNIDFMRVRSFEIETPGIPVQLDGDAAGETPMTFECVPAAATMIVPRGLTTPLFRLPPLPRATT